MQALSPGSRIAAEQLVADTRPNEVKFDQRQNAARSAWFGLRGFNNYGPAATEVEELLSLDVPFSVIGWCVLHGVDSLDEVVKLRDVPVEWLDAHADQTADAYVKWSP